MTWLVRPVSSMNREPVTKSQEAGFGRCQSMTPFSSTWRYAMRVAIYARVSADDKGQDPENQLREHFVILVLPL
jgi:hypothetical protein